MSGLRQRLLASFGFAALLATTAAQAQTKTNATTPAANPPPKPSLVDIESVTRWDVTYEDERLGMVHGTAYVDWNFEKNLSGSPASGRVIGLPEEVYRGINGELTGKAHLVIHDPTTGQDQDLWAYKITRTGPEKTGVAMTFDGMSPSSKPVDPPDTNKFPPLSTDDGQKVKISVGAFEQEVTVRSKARAQSQRVIVALKQQPNFGVLDGSWGYYADPLTERGGDKKGRVGLYRLLNKDEISQLNDPPHDGANDQYSTDGAFLGLQTEWEQWWPLPTEIAAIAVIEDQLSYRKLDLGGPLPLQVPVFQAPFQDGWRAPAWGNAPPEARYRWNTGEDKHRTLLVVGRNLPIDMGKSIAFGSAGDDIASAHLLATSQDKDSSDANQKLVEQGWARIRGELADKDHPTSQDDVSRGMDWVLVDVTLKDRVLPGPRTFHWGGAKHDWLLQFGNNDVGLRWVRPLSEGSGTSETRTEASPLFYVPERVAVEVQTRIDLPLDTIPVIVGSGGSGTTMVARRIDTSLYRTDFFQLGSALPAQPGNVLQASIDQHKLLDDSHVQFVKATLTSASVGEIPNATRDGDGPWKDALLQAASTDKIETRNLTLAELAAKALEPPAAPAVPVSGMSSSTLSQPDYVDQDRNFYGIKLHVGEHAAMLLLRRTFVDMMTRQLDFLEKLQKKDEDARKFWDWLRPCVLYDPDTFYTASQSAFSSNSVKDMIARWAEERDQDIADMQKLFKALPGIVLGTGGPDPRRDSSFARIAVAGLDGGTTTLYDAFDQESALRKNADPDKFRKWQIDSARTVASQYVTVVKASRDRAHDIKDGDLQDLLKLTGLSFGPIVNEITPGLMRLSSTPNGSIWVQDPIARASVATLRTTAGAVRAQADYSDIQSQYEILAITAILAVPAMVSESAMASVVSLAGNVTLWSAASVKEILDTHQGQQDVAFEFGNALVLGPERLHEAEVRKSEWYETVLSIAAQGVLVGIQAKYDTLPKIARENAAYRAEQLLQKLGGDPAKVFRTLTPQQQSDVMVLMERATIRIEDTAPVSKAQIKAKYKAEQIHYESRGPPAQKTPQGANAQPPTPTEPVPTPSLPEGAQSVSAEENLKTMTQTSVSFETLTASNFEALTTSSASSDLPKVNAPPNEAWVVIQEGGQAEVEYKLKRLGNPGATSEVYDVLDVRGRDRSILDKPKVLKFIGDHPDFGSPQKTIERMRTANEEYKATRNGMHPIKFAEVREFHPNADRPYILQDKVVGDNIKIFKLEDLEKMTARAANGIAWAKPYSETEKIFSRGMQRAMMQLHLDHIANDLFGGDISLLNVFFENAGGDEWICGPLDLDFVVNTKKPDKSNYTWGKIYRLQVDPEVENVTSQLLEGRTWDTYALMRAMLEKTHGGNGRIPFVTADNQIRGYLPDLIQPDIAKIMFPELDNLTPPPPPPPPLKSPRHRGITPSRGRPVCRRAVTQLPLAA